MLIKLFAKTLENHQIKIFLFKFGCFLFFFFFFKERRLPEAATAATAAPPRVSADPTPCEAATVGLWGVGGRLRSQPTRLPSGAREDGFKISDNRKLEGEMAV